MGNTEIDNDDRSANFSSNVKVESDNSNCNGSRPLNQCNSNSFGTPSNGNGYSINPGNPGHRRMNGINSLNERNGGSTISNHSNTSNTGNSYNSSTNNNHRTLNQMNTENTNFAINSNPNSVSNSISDRIPSTNSLQMASNRISNPPNPSNPPSNQRGRRSIESVDPIPEAPECSHKQPMTQRLTRKPGRNQGRKFWCCGMAQQDKCKSFKWDDEWQRERHKKRRQSLSNSLHSNRITVSSKSMVLSTELLCIDPDPLFLVTVTPPSQPFIAALRRCKNAVFNFDKKI